MELMWASDHGVSSEPKNNAQKTFQHLCSCNMHQTCDIRACVRATSHAAPCSRPPVLIALPPAANVQSGQLRVIRPAVSRHLRFPPDPLEASAPCRPRRRCTAAVQGAGRQMSRCSVAPPVHSSTAAAVVAAAAHHPLPPR